MIVVIETNVSLDDGEVVSKAYGPFRSHAEANSNMQANYDAIAADVESADMDDSDASHFYIKGDDQEIHWFAEEVQSPH